MDSKKGDWREDISSGCLDALKSVFSWNRIVDEARDDDLVDSSDVRLFNIIGDGAQAYVYRACWKNREVALKIFKDDNEVSLSELKKLLKLKNQNVISLKGLVEKFERGQTRHTLYGPGLIMEYCKHSLHDMIHDKKRSIGSAQVLDWAKEIVAGMQYLHKKQIIHRDLKSPNVLLGFDNRLKISDLDSHTWSKEVDTTISFRGTPHWMAPELIRAEKCSSKVDVWSFGVVIWELLTRQEPYKNLNSNQVIFGVGGGKLKLPIPSSCPSQIGGLLEMCWNCEPHRRPAFFQIKNVIMFGAEMEMRNLPLSKLEDDRCKWQREINTVLEDYKNAKEISTQIRKEESLKEVNKLRDKMESIIKSKIATGELSPHDIQREFSRLPGSLRAPMYRFATDAISPTEHVRSNSNRSNRTRTRQRQRRPSALFTTPHLSDSDHNGEDESGDSFERSSTVGRPRTSLQFRKRTEKGSSSSEDANISSASPLSSAEEDAIQSDFFSSAEEDNERVEPQVLTSPSFDRSVSIDEGFSSRGPSTRTLAKNLQPNHEYAQTNNI